jgi:hypothetical protein
MKAAATSWPAPAPLLRSTKPTENQENVHSGEYVYVGYSRKGYSGKANKLH